jgi:DNA-binding MarR family transcriptional regulator
VIIRRNDRLFNRIDSFTRFYKQTIMSMHRSQPVEGLSPLAFAMLNEVAGAGEITVTELAQRMGISMPNCSRYLRWLIRDGYLIRRQNSDDRRVYHTALTEQGVRTIARALEHTKERATPLINRLSDREVERIVESMDYIEEVFSRIHGETEDQDEPPDQTVTRSRPSRFD